MTLSRTQVLEWFKKFEEGKEVIEDDPSPGRPRKSKTDGNIEKIREIIRKNWCLSIRAIAELVNIDKKTVWKILHENLQMKKVCAKMVPKLHTPEQQETRLNMCVEILENIENDPKFLENVITCDESGFFQYDPETKRQFMHWKSLSSPRQKKHGWASPNSKQWLFFFRYPRNFLHRMGTWRSNC